MWEINATHVHINKKATAYFTDAVVGTAWAGPWQSKVCREGSKLIPMAGGGARLL